MATRITLMIESGVIRAANKYALEQGRSLSGIVESYLKSIATAEEHENEVSPEIRQMMGVIKSEKGFEYRKALRKAVSAKYSR